MQQLKYVERCQAQREINLIDVDGLGRVGPWDFRLFVGFCLGVQCLKLLEALFSC